VILDDLVLDVTHFQANHPGGRFSISQNIGRDVSKFFYGGYLLENYQGRKPFTHDNTAKSIVNSLIIAKLNKQSSIRDVKIVSKDKANELTDVFVLKSAESIIE
jgi:cytochrome b involved in lipid metabolism